MSASSVLRHGVLGNLKSVLFVSLLLILATGVTFGRGLNFAFLAYDDGAHIYANPYVSPVKTESILHFWNVPFRERAPLIAGRELPPYEQLFGPVTFTVWSLLSPINRLPQEVELSGHTKSSINPQVYHAANLIVHALNGVLWFVLLLRLLKSQLGAGLGALVWLVHPLQAESVLWVTQLNTLLSLFFSLLALHAYLSFDRLRRWGTSGLTWLYLGLSGLAFFLALLAKPLAAVMAPIAFLLCSLDRHINPLPQDSSETTSVRQPNSLWSQVWPLLPWLLFALIIIRINQNLQEGIPNPYLEPWKRPFQIGDALAFYLVKTLVPVNLTPDYGRLPQLVFEHGWAYYTWLLPVAILAAIWFKWRHPVWVAAAGIFVLALLPTSGITPYYFHFYSTVADRYAYIALLGPTLALAWLVKSSGRVPWGKLVVPVYALVLMGLGWQQASIWKNNFTLWTHAVAQNPNSFLGSHNLATAYMEAGEKARAIELYRAVLKLRPEKAEAQYNLGFLLEEIAPTPQGVYHLQQALRLEPYDPLTHNQIAVALVKRGQLDEAIGHWRRATELDPKYADAFVNLGVALAMTGKQEAAISAWKSALKLKPDSVDLRYNLGIALEKRGDLAGARRLWQEAVRLDPQYERAQAALARTAAKQP